MAVLDWTNPDHYKYTEGLTLHQWAWEFLRRNPDYRSRYFGLEYESPGRYTDESQDEFVRIARDYDLLGIYHPDATAAELDELKWAIGTGVRILWRHPNPELEEFNRAQPPWPGYPFGLALLFNLREAIGPQMRAAERLVGEHREHLARAYVAGLKKPRRSKSRYRPDTFPTYVRALDGQSVGASQRVIGGALYPDSPEPRDAARRALETAARLASGDYRELLYKPDI